MSGRLPRRAPRIAQLHMCTVAYVHSCKCAQLHMCTVQVLCAAMPVAYVSNTTPDEWEPFAVAMLESAYDSTLLTAACIARRENRRLSVFLTKLGAGAFGNLDAWVKRAMDTVRVRASTCAR
jgi:hypothetical protein